MTISGSVILRIRNVADEYYRKNPHIYFMLIKIFSKVLPFVR
jgi:hypothetical protein